MMLEAGMVLYGEEHFGKYLHKYTITRVTANQAIIEVYKPDGSLQYDIRFNRDIGDKRCLRAKGDRGFTYTTYYIDSPLMQSRFERQELLAKFTKVDVVKLSNNQLRAMVKIMEGEEK